MYTLLVVDDEALIREAITSIIDWESLGFTTIFQAEDGLEALEICRSDKIDLVLTDIVMPFMDGMELTRVLHDEFPQIHIVILTGHEEFEYAKEAIDMSVKNYILKPVGAKTLYSKMEAICKEFRIKATKEEYLSKMRTQVRQSIPVLREKFLYSLVCSQYNKMPNIEQRIQSLEIPLHSTKYLIGVVDTDISQADLDMELYFFTLQNITNDTVGRQHCIFDNNEQIIIIFNLDFYEDDAHDIALKTLDVLIKAIQSVMKIQVTCAVGSEVDSYEDLYYSYIEANQALDFRYSLGENKVYDIADLDYLDHSFFYPYEDIKQVVYQIKTGNMQQIREAVEHLSGVLVDRKNLSKVNIKMVFMELLNSILKEFSAVKNGKDDIWKAGSSIYTSLDQDDSLHKVKERIIEFAIQVAEMLSKVQINSGQVTVDKVKKFVDANYSLEECSLSMAADNAGVSAGYLSALFKKLVGVKFIEYLTNVRMEQARLLLKTTDLKHYEVAYEVGYANPHYFSVAFKKHVGVSPSEFKTL